MADKIDQLKIGSNDYDITLPVDDKNAMFYETESATANAFTVTIPGIDALVDGMIINVKFHAATAEDATLNVNGLGAKEIYYRTATAVTTHIIKNNYVTLIYDGTNDHWVMQYNYDSAPNSVGYQLRTNSSVWTNKTGYSMNRYPLFFEVEGGLSGAATTISTGTSKTTVPFKYIPGGAIKYYSTSGAIANNANFAATGLWDQYAVNLRYTFNTGTTLINNEPVYMRCIINSDGTLTPDYTGSPKHPVAQALPTTEDGKAYVYLGKAYSTSSMELHAYHPIYQFKDGKICLYTGGNPTVNNGMLTITQNSTLKGIFTANSSANVSVDIATPTKDSDLDNDRYVRFDDAQGLEADAQAQARANISAAAGNHTHTASISQSGSSGTSLAHNTWYTLTAGGSTVTFKTPSDSNTNYYATSDFTSSNGTKIATGHSGSSTSTTYDLYAPNATTTQAGVLKIGTGASDACAGNDSRLSDSRTPKSHAHGNIANDGTITSTAVTSATGVLVYDSSNKIQRATAANARIIIGAGTYSKPSSGIPASDLAETYYLASNPNNYTSVTQSTVSSWGFTKNTGTITGVSVNGTSVATSGVANITSIPWSIVSNKPTIPTKVTDLSDASNYINTGDTEQEKTGNLTLKGNLYIGNEIPSNGNGSTVYFAKDVITNKRSGAFSGFYANSAQWNRFYGLAYNKKYICKCNYMGDGSATTSPAADGLWECDRYGNSSTGKSEQLAALFDSKFNNGAIFPTANLSTKPVTISIVNADSSEFIDATDTAYLMINGWRFDGRQSGWTYYGKLTNYKVELLLKNVNTNNLEWVTTFERTGATDGIENICIPLWSSTKVGSNHSKYFPSDASDYKFFYGVRLVISGAIAGDVGSGKFGLTELKLMETRPAGTPADGVGALPLMGGTLYGDLVLSSKYTDQAIRPEVNKNGYLGTSNYQWKAVYGENLYENGTSLEDKYSIDIVDLTNL